MRQGKRGGNRGGEGGGLQGSGVCVGCLMCEGVRCGVRRSENTNWVVRVW